MGTEETNFNVAYQVARRNNELKVASVSKFKCVSMVIEGTNRAPQQFILNWRSITSRSSVILL